MPEAERGTSLSPSGHRPRLLLAIAALFVLALVHIGLGAHAWLSPLTVLNEIVAGPNGTSANHVIVWELRLPRAAMALLAGFGLGVVGASYQAVFRNALAEPFILGSASGSAIGAVAISLAGVTGSLAVVLSPIAAFLGGLFSIGLVLLVGDRKARMSTELLLAGVVIGTLLSSVLSLLILASGRDSGVVLRWLLGSFSSANWVQIGLAFVTVMIGTALLGRHARAMNVMAAALDSAVALGVNALKVRQHILLVGTVITSVLVGACGIIGFVGLVGPHIARRWNGVNFQKSLPLSGVIGAMITLLADGIAQRGLYGTELPVGVVTAVIGAPALILLLRRAKL